MRLVTNTTKVAKLDSFNATFGYNDKSCEVSFGNLIAKGIIIENVWFLNVLFV